MESNAVLFYKKGPVLSAILHYYGPTHRCFLLLSQLCKGSRDTLKHNYKAFANDMRPYWETFYWGKNFEGKFPPWDLYKLDFDNEIPLNFNW